MVRQTGGKSYRCVVMQRPTIWAIGLIDASHGIRLGCWYDGQYCAPNMLVGGRHHRPAVAL